MVAELLSLTLHDQKGVGLPYSGFESHSSTSFLGLVCIRSLMQAYFFPFQVFNMYLR